MIEVTNRQRFPVQLVIRSRKAPRAFTTLNVPAIGKGHNVRLIEDERHTEYIDRAEKMGLISVRQVPNDLSKGE